MNVRELILSEIAELLDEAWLTVRCVPPYFTVRSTGA